MKREMSLAWTLPLMDSAGSVAIDVRIDLDSLRDTDREIIFVLIDAFRNYAVGGLSEERMRE